MIKETLGLDDKDLRIISLLTKNPEASQSSLAAALKLSQPSVNARMHKLKSRGILATSVGIELDKTNMVLARVDFTANNAHDILKDLKDCSFFVNGFVMSGQRNTSILVVSANLQKIEAIIDKHLRADPNIKDIRMDVVVSTAKPFICSIDLARTQHEECTHKNCESCKISVQKINV